MDSSNTTGVDVSGWSWGGSFATVYTLLASRMYGTVIVYFILLIIPFVNFIAAIGFFIFGGLKGKEWITKNPMLFNDDQRIGAIKTTESVGFAFMILFAIGIVAFILFWGVLASIFMSAVSGGLR